MYSPGAIDLRTADPVDLPRLTDRVSWLQVEHAQITQTRTGLVAWCDDGTRVEIPCATLGALLCGPGTSITHDAATTLHNAGCVVLWTSHQGITGYQTAVPLTGSAKWAQAQARMWADPQARHAAAVTLYNHRLPQHQRHDTTPLRVLRGLEGQTVKAAYRAHARRLGLTGWRRDTSSDDPVNTNLNIANSILYACALAACSALAISPALGVIHHGNVSAFLFDLADLHKITLSIPAAFTASTEPRPDRAVRRLVRQAIHNHQLPTQLVTTVTNLLEPHVQAASEDELLDDNGDMVPGHKNWHLQ